jgi:hypothetical protein
MQLNRDRNMHQHDRSRIFTAALTGARNGVILGGIVALTIHVLAYALDPPGGWGEVYAWITTWLTLSGFPLSLVIGPAAYLLTLSLTGGVWQVAVLTLGVLLNWSLLSATAAVMITVVRKR